MGGQLRLVCFETLAKASHRKVAAMTRGLVEHAVDVPTEPHREQLLDRVLVVGPPALVLLVELLDGFVVQVGRGSVAQRSKRLGEE
jgi:hypothetical protein